jgi:hypothetical protein
MPRTTVKTYLHRAKRLLLAALLTKGEKREIVVLTECARGSWAFV